MQTVLDSYLAQGWIMEGQTLYSMFKRVLKLIPKEVCIKVAPKDTGLRPVSGDNLICTDWHKLEMYQGKDLDFIQCFGI